MKTYEGTAQNHIRNFQESADKNRIWADGYDHLASAQIDSNGGLATYYRAERDHLEASADTCDETIERLRADLDSYRAMGGGVL